MPEPIGSVTTAPLDKTWLETRIRSRKNGAVVTFEGIVRDHDHGEDVGSLDYEAHPDAERVLIDVCARIAQATNCDVVAAHRIGHLEIGDVALVAVVAAPHRAEAAITDEKRPPDPALRLNQTASMATDWPRQESSADVIAAWR